MSDGGLVTHRVEEKHRVPVVTLVVQVIIDRNLFIPLGVQGGRPPPPLRATQAPDPLREPLQGRHQDPQDTTRDSVNGARQEPGGGNYEGFHDQKPGQSSEQGPNGSRIALKSADLSPVDLGAGHNVKGGGGRRHARHQQTSNESRAVSYPMLQTFFFFFFFFFSRRNG